MAYYNAKKVSQSEIMGLVDSGIITKYDLKKLQSLKPKKERQIEIGKVLRLNLNNQYIAQKGENGWDIQMITEDEKELSLCPKFARSLEDLSVVIGGFDREKRNDIKIKE